MSAFLHLYLGHLFGDYVLQSGWIAYRKGKDKRVLVLHVLLVTLSHAIFVLGKGIEPVHFLWIAILGFGHFLQDSFKISKGNGSWVWYSLDQIVHLFMVFLVSPFFHGVDFFVPDWIASRMALSIFNAYLIGILFHTVFNNGGVYRRDLVGYLFRASFPWIPNVFWTMAAVASSMVITWKLCKRRDTVYSTAVSGLLTILWEVIS